MDRPSPEGMGICFCGKKPKRRMVEMFRGSLLNKTVPLSMRWSDQETKKSSVVLSSVFKDCRSN